MINTVEQIERVINIADRCDRCSAQAFVLAKLVAGELYFCGHHFVKHEEEIRNSAFEIIDERNFINERSASSV